MALRQWLSHSWFLPFAGRRSIPDQRAHFAQTAFLQPGRFAGQQSLPVREMEADSFGGAAERDESQESSYPNHRWDRSNDGSGVSPFRRDDALVAGGWRRHRVLNFYATRGKKSYSQS